MIFYLYFMRTKNVRCFIPMQKYTVYGVEVTFETSGLMLDTGDSRRINFEVVVSSVVKYHNYCSQ
jgi:hypothetical protein